MTMQSLLSVFELMRSLFVVGFCLAAPVVLALLVLSESKHKNL
jgi:hypothetical protein